ncbi:MAG: response regulator [Telluria sp.]
MRFSDISIRVRIGAGFTLLMLMVLAVIYVGVSRIYAIRADNEHLLQQEWIALDAANQIQTNSREAAMRISTLIIQQDRDQRVAAYARIDRAKAQLDRQLARLSTLDLTPEARALVQAIAKSRSAYYDSFIDMADFVESGDREGAELRMNGMALPRLEVLLKQIEELDALQGRQIQAAAQMSRHDINVSLAEMAGIGALAVLAGIGFAASVRTITRPLDAAIQVARRVADGDLTTMIHVTSKDETGQLLRALQDMTASLARQQELQRAVMVAEDATRMKSDFLANMSHEIRTPMNAIIGMTHLALQTELTPRQRNYLDKVDAAARNLLGIINDILDFSKIEAGKLAFERVDFSLDDVLQQLADLATIKAQDKGLELLFDVAPDVPRELVGDPLRLGQVMLNLVGNAVKFTERGEVVVRVRAEPAPAGEARLRVEVRDTGIGLSDAARARLFQAFTQADSSTTRHYGGTGLGLTISKRLVEMMGGEIGVDSAPGEGSTFHFTAAFGLPDGHPARAAAGERELAGLRVLVVDDNATAREIFRHMLASFGIEAVTAGDGAAAVRAAQDAAAGEAFQLALVDWQMPGMDGLATVRALRERLGPSSAPRCVLATAYQRDELPGDAAELVDGVVSKPVSASTLFDAIATALGKEVAPRGRRRREADYREAAAAVRGAHVLLVDDNEVNQEVALDILGGAGVTVDVAGNGAMALARLAQQRYDGVLMDCQMPVMDGYEATRRLRQDPALANLPVIAMTANAMVGDKEKCLAAGMNDFIAKPIDVAQLFTTLARWVKPANPGAAAGTPAPRSATLPAIACLDLAPALARVGGSVPLMRKLLERFHTTQRDAAGRIEQAMAANDAAAATREAHTLKGLAGNIGATAVARLAGQLEQMFAQGQSAGARPALDELAVELAATVQAIAVAMEAAPAPAPTQAPALERTALEAQLRQLAGLLAEDDSGAARLAEEVLPLLQEAGQGDHARQLKRLVSQYDFEGALEQLELAARALDLTLAAKEA